MHKNKMIFVTSSLQYDIIRVMPFHILIFDMISIRCISNLILKVVPKKQNIIYRYFNLKERERESNSKVKKEKSPHKGLPGGAWARTRGKRVTLDWHLHGG